MSKRIFWPDNMTYIAFSVMVTAGAFTLFVKYFSWPLIPFPLFLMAAQTIFAYAQSIIIDNRFVYGPTAYGTRKGRVKIPFNEAEGLFEESRFSKEFIIRHKSSSKQITVPYKYFASSTIKELKEIFKR